MKLINTRCAICESQKNYIILYKRNFSDADFNKDIFSARRLPDRIHYQMVKCTHDGLVRSHPILSEKELAKLYKDSLFTYDNEAENLTTTYLESLMPVLTSLSKKDRILEIGCGNGFILQALYDKGYHNVYGIEPSTDALKMASKKIRKNIKETILKSGVFPKKTFAFIFFFQTLDHIADPDTFLKDCYDLLKPGGYILSFNHNIDSLSSKILKEKSPIIDIEHTYLYSFITMRKLFEKHKFTVEKVYSPETIISLRHILWLLPLPKLLKSQIKASKLFLFDLPLKVRLGNVCLVGKK